MTEQIKPEFVSKLETQWAKDNTVCVGLDTDYSQLPLPSPRLSESRRNSREWRMFAFNADIIDATAGLVCAYKPNIAFYEAEGIDGYKALAKTINYIHTMQPDIPVILDAKRADIGNTNNGYVKAAFDELKADAITVHPYLGKEALKPFLQRRDKGILVLAKTSNPGAGEFQDIEGEIDGGKEKLYQRVARNVAENWNEYGNCGIVVGATYPKELAEVRKIVGDIPILIPGIGAQGGEVEATVKAGKSKEGTGMIINSSRGIIFASKGANYAEAAQNETKRLRDEINKYR